MQLSNIKFFFFFLLQSDHGIRLTLATEIGMESEDSHHTSLFDILSGYVRLEQVLQCTCAV